MCKSSTVCLFFIVVQVFATKTIRKAMTLQWSEDLLCSGRSAIVLLIYVRTTNDDGGGGGGQDYSCILLLSLLLLLL